MGWGTNDHCVRGREREGMRGGGGQGARGGEGEGREEGREVGGSGKGREAGEATKRRGNERAQGTGGTGGKEKRARSSRAKGSTVLFIASRDQPSLVPLVDARRGATISRPPSTFLPSLDAPLILDAPLPPLFKTRSLSPLIKAHTLPPSLASLPGANLKVTPTQTASA
ncbi:uncharacterized protein SCHCODRAFT_02105546 [Schizophyllum commune H4-8]|uniref:uncharacterized protein n=1 Tax=Schizophyllum commune (strain H4-8 / FGSC 9210) TaxID=578458 RepID=UPI00215F90FB|nr:uncharacterized protein SCHCODRAFT_02105546 [Schizophyllum commune H4-8]KAI5885773.1 hypothetical protein SCHCODRAFT_02105546 [Schizophyllum commune H4-8]